MTSEIKISNREIYHCQSMIELAHKVALINEKIKDIKEVPVAIDCEWTPNTSISLIQIAFKINHEIYILLIHTSYLTHIPKNFNKLMNRDKLKLYGFSFDNDIKQFNKINYDNPWLYNVIDIQDTCNDLLFSKRKVSLESSIQCILGIDINKNKKITCSDWDKDKLSYSQLLYAANDALYTLYIALKCFHNILINEEDNSKRINKLCQYSGDYCWNFIRTGNCKFQHNCRYKHDLETYFLIVNNSLCMTDIHYECKKKNCKFIHLD